MKKKEKVFYLDYMCEPGQTVRWTDMAGNSYIGKLISMDENCVATVKLQDGSIVTYQC